MTVYADGRRRLRGPLPSPCPAPLPILGMYSQTQINHKLQFPTVWDGGGWRQAQGGRYPRWLRERDRCTCPLAVTTQKHHYSQATNFSRYLRAFDYWVPLPIKLI